MPDFDVAYQPRIHQSLVEATGDNTTLHKLRPRGWSSATGGCRIAWMPGHIRGRIAQRPEHDTVDHRKSVVVLYTGIGERSGHARADKTIALAILIP